MTIIFIAIGGVLVYWGQMAKNNAPYYKSNFLIMEIGAIIAFVGISLFIFVPLLQGFLQPDNVLPEEPPNFDPATIEGYVAIEGDVISEVKKCGERFCFDVEIITLRRGSIDSDSVKVETDKEFVFTEGFVSVSGVFRDGKVFALNENVSEILSGGDFE